MNPDPAETNLPRQQLWFALAVAVVTLACFCPVISSDFVLWDDDINIYENSHIKGLTAENLRWMFTDLVQTLRFKPLNWLAWATIYEVAGIKPAAFHLANVLLHTANAGLVYLLFSALLRSGKGSHLAVRTQLCAAIGALVWSLHPLRVEPVAWATGLPYELALLFALTSVNLYWRFATGPEPRAWAAWTYRGSIACYLLALLTYPIILGLAVVPVAMDWWLARELGHQGRWLRARHLPFLIGAALLVGVNFLGRLTPNPVYVEAAPLATFSVLDRAMQGFYVWTYFLIRHVWTAGLSVVYYELVGFDPWSWPFVASAVFVVVASVTLFGLRRRWPFPWVAWACHLLWLVPVLGLTENQHSPSDRYTYASGLLIGLLVAVGLHHLAGSERWRLGLMGAGAGLGLFAWQSSVLLPNWRDSGHLFRHVISVLEKDGQRSGIWTRLGHWHLMRREFAEAELAYRNALPGAHDLPDLHFRLACVIHEQKRYREALPHYEIAHRAGKLTDELLGDYGIALIAAGQAENAEKHFAEAVRLAPTKPRHRQNWALTLKRLGREAEAAAQQAEAQRLSSTPQPASGLAPK